MRFPAVYLLGLGLAAMVLTAPAVAAEQLEITSHSLSDGKVEVEVLNRGTEPLLATVWFRPNYQYAGLGASSDRRPRTVSTSEVVDANSQKILVVEGDGLMSRLRDPGTISLSCASAKE